MEKEVFREITIVLLPPLLNQPELTGSDSAFLDLGNIISLKSSSTKLSENKKENPSTLIGRITRARPSRKIINLASSKNRNLGSAKLMLVNYPINKNQLENLEKNFERVGFKISRLVVVSLSSFDILATAEEQNFLCPYCLKSYSKKDFFELNRYLCPLDKKDFSVSYVDKFTNYLTTYYLQNSIEVIQNFAKNENQKGRKVLNLNINSTDNLTENIRKNLLAIIQKE